MVGRRRRNGNRSSGFAQLLTSSSSTRNRGVGGNLDLDPLHPGRLLTSLNAQDQYRQAAKTMRCTVCHLLAIAAAARALSSHSPQDLYAYPKYSVQLTDWDAAINNATAETLLSEARETAEGRSDVESDELVMQADAVRGRIRTPVSCTLGFEDVMAPDLQDRRRHRSAQDSCAVRQDKLSSAPCRRYRRERARRRRSCEPS